MRLAIPALAFVWLCAATDLYTLPDDPDLWANNQIPFFYESATYTHKPWPLSIATSPVGRPVYGPDPIYPAIITKTGPFSGEPPIAAALTEAAMPTPSFVFLMRFRMDANNFKNQIHNNSTLPLGGRFALLSVSLKGPDSVVDELAETAHFYISHYWKRKAIIGVRHYKIESSLIEDPLFISASTTGSLDILTDEDADTYALCTDYHTLWVTYEPDVTSGRALLSVGLGTNTLFLGSIPAVPIYPNETPTLSIGKQNSLFNTNPNLYVPSALLFSDLPVSPVFSLSRYADDLIRLMNNGMFDRLRAGEFASPPPSPQHSPPPPSVPAITGSPPPLSPPPLPVLMPRNSGNATAIGIGMGVGGGVLLLLVAIMLGLFLTKRRSRTTDSNKLSYVWPGAAKAQSDVVRLTFTNDGTFDNLALDISQLPDYERESMCLAQGYFGSVYIIQWQGRPAALKVFDFTSKPSHVAGDYAKEIAVLSRLDHPNIIRMIGHGMDEARGKGYMLMELAEGLSLFDLLYPKVDLVVPSDVPDLLEKAKAGWDKMKANMMEDLRMTFSMHPDYVLFQLSEPLLGSTKQARELIAQLVIGSRLAPVSKLWTKLMQTPELLRVQHPMVVVRTGPLVLHQAIDIAGVGDPTFLRNCINNLLDDQAPKLDLLSRTRISLETWRACNYLHNLPSGRTIVHSDLKPANILLDRNMNVKLADVGFALALQLPAQQSFLHSIPNQGTTGGTKGYRCPDQNNPEKPRYGEKNDVYSFGVCALELLRLERLTTKEISMAITELIKHCTAPWDKRMTSNELLAALEDLYTMCAEHVARTSVCQSTSEIEAEVVSTTSGDSRPVQGLPFPEGTHEDWLLSKDRLPVAWRSKVSSRAGVRSSVAAHMNPLGSHSPPLHPYPSSITQ